MSKTIVSHSYNMDLLSFINVMTSDPFYVNYYQKEFDLFYPLLSDEVKVGISQIVSSTGVSNLAPFFTTIISSIPNYNELDVKNMLLMYEEIDQNMKDFPYYNLYKEHIKLLPQISGVFIRLITELEENGFKEYWMKEKLPKITSRCDEVERLLNTYKIRQHITKYKSLSTDDIVVYLSCFANPHGTRLIGNVLLLDIVYSDKTIVNNVSHELFHPPYNSNETTDLIHTLSQFQFVQDGFKNQNPQFAYSPIELFIEECIVEALAIHVVNVLDLEDKPFEYFEKHDEGSHVISPHFYRFLKLNDIQMTESFNEYLEKFISYLKETLSN